MLSKKESFPRQPLGSSYLCSNTKEVVNLNGEKSWLPNVDRQNGNGNVDYNDNVEKIDDGGGLCHQINVAKSADCFRKRE